VNCECAVDRDLVDTIASGQLADAAIRSRQWMLLQVHLADGSIFLHEMTSWPPSWKCDTGCLQLF